jgi:hypothetical protein
MESKWTGLRALREKIQPIPGYEERETGRLEAEVADWKLCLAGNPASEKWKLLRVELTNKESALLNKKRRFAGRTPQMESWADPLPG